MSTKVLVHSGTKGMKWYHRRYQNYDGSLTAEGRIHYGVGSARGSKKKGISLAQDRANRAKTEAEAAKKIATKYVDAMERKKADRQLKANKKGTWQSEDRAQRARDEYESAKKIATKYVDAMNKKAVSRQEMADGTYKHPLVKKIEEQRGINSQKKIDRLEKQKKFDVDSFNAITEDLKYKHGPNKGKVYYSVEDAKRDQKVISDTYDKKIAKLKDKTNYGSSEVVMDAKYKELSDSPVKKAYTRDQSNAIASDADKLVSGSNSLRKSVSKSRDLSQYSDAELQKIVNRQQLEQRYNQLNPDKIDKGTSILRESIQTAGAAAGLYASYKIIKNL